MKRNIMLILASIVMLTLGTAAQSPVRVPNGGTLAKLLEANGISDVRGLPAGWLQMLVSHYDIAADPREFIFAGFDEDNISKANPDTSVYVAIFDKSSGQWRHNVITPEEPVGTIIRIITTEHYLSLVGHLTPSATRLVVLTRELKLRRAIFGWPIAKLPDEALMYHHSMIHFAPTRPTEISVFSPETGRERQIYPPLPDNPVRSAFIERLRKAYRARGEAWFRENNHHMTPELFDSSLVSDVVLDERSKSAAFHVRYSSDAASEDEFQEDVLVTCTPIDDLTRIACKERLLAVWIKTLGLAKAPIATVLQRAASNPGAVR